MIATAASARSSPSGRVPLGADELALALDPGGYLGSARAFVDRALELYVRGIGSEVE